MRRNARLFSLLHHARWALLLPFVLMALLAPGVMPQRAADGQMMLVLCTPEGPSEMVIDLATGQPVPADAPQDGRCDWAMAQAAAVLPFDAPATAWPLVLARAEHAAGASLWRAGALPGAVTARGPPILT
ncbi:DUF2946 family protein [Fertoebacter nigrum]|uniref:DUF2946 family protein n=1 Tax=Fertoeibacter niger TaxID=2656921 RepID=A0A8X8KKT9_9RHOB|nr:DUF2946 family protein [Fertoeibacter niger]NUB44629.1 DUF2946 family protein [Fertoeibacter niger]